MKIFRYDTPIELIDYTQSIFLAGPTVRGNQQHLISWRFEAIEIFKSLGFKGSLIIPEFEDKTKSDKGRVELPIWEHNGLSKSDVILFWVCRTRELYGLNTNSEHGYWLAKNPHKIVYARPDDAFRIQYNDIMHNQVYKELGVYEPIYNTLESGIKSSIEKIPFML